MAKKKRKPKHDPEWAKAKKLCRLNMEDIRMAKELGMSPRSLTKNIPSPSQRWKAPVKIWIRDLYEKKQQKTAKKAAKKKSKEPAGRSEDAASAAATARHTNPHKQAFHAGDGAHSSDQPPREVSANAEATPDDGDPIPF